MEIHEAKISEAKTVSEIINKSFQEQALMDFAEKELREQGVSLIELSIVRQFERLNEYYLSLGYKIMIDRQFPSFPFETSYFEKEI